MRWPVRHVSVDRARRSEDGPRSFAARACLTLVMGLACHPARGLSPRPVSGTAGQATAPSLAGPGTPAAAPGSAPLPAREVTRLRAYIATTWDTLTRRPADIARAAPDSKVPKPPARWPVYVSPTEDVPAVAARLAAEVPAAARASFEVRPLPPRSSDGSLPATEPPGLLYVPAPYVVPGGRFNELYGWDSYFIVRGLLRDGRVELARAQTDDQLYEVRHYGKVLNANRTYYLTRSQPPFLSRMVWDVYEVTHDRAWLASTREALEATYAFWTRAPHLAGDTGLSRYFDTGEGPAPEVVHGERDGDGLSHYDRVRAFYRSHPDADDGRAYDRTRDRLTPAFFVGDRAMRESGFDPTDRWGRFGIGTTRHAPVELNVLVAVLASDLARLALELGDVPAAARFAAEARAQHARIDRFLWDPARGLYLDWDVDAGARRDYPFATTFWPLWAGLASREQAARVRANLSLFERPGGLRTSDQVTGKQWDAPFGWAPLQLMAVEGLRRYGYAAEAARVSRAFLSMVLEDFGRRGTLVEKYDVDRRTSQVESGITFGYAENQVGFGWTNAVVVELLQSLGGAGSAGPPRSLD